jgi:hypothetical protein
MVHGEISDLHKKIKDFVYIRKFRFSHATSIRSFHFCKLFSLNLSGDVCICAHGIVTVRAIATIAAIVNIQ